MEAMRTNTETAACNVPHSLSISNTGKAEAGLAAVLETVLNWSCKRGGSLQWNLGSSGGEEMRLMLLRSRNAAAVVDSQ